MAKQDRIFGLRRAALTKETESDGIRADYWVATRNLPHSFEQKQRESCAKLFLFAKNGHQPIIDNMRYAKQTRYFHRPAHDSTKIIFTSC